MLVALFALILVPLVAYRIARQKQPTYLWSVTGLTFGLVAYPASFELYTMAFVHFVGFVPGMIGLQLTLLHDAPRFDIPTILGLRESGKVVRGNEHLVIGMINGLVWGVVYGVIGFGIDKYRKARQLNTGNA